MGVLRRIRFVSIAAAMLSLAGIMLLTGSCSVMWDTPYDIDLYYDDPLAPPPPVVKTLPAPAPRVNTPKPKDNNKPANNKPANSQPANKPANNGSASKPANNGSSSRPAGNATAKPSGNSSSSNSSSGQRQGANARH